MQTLLLNNIKEVIDDNVKKASIFCDIFSGTSTVARYFKKYYEILSNDNLYFSYVLQKATIENNKIPKFNKLNFNPIEYLNNLDNAILENLIKMDLILIKALLMKWGDTLMKMHLEVKN